MNKISTKHKFYEITFSYLKRHGRYDVSYNGQAVFLESVHMKEIVHMYSKS
jgi:hypothetical protein